MTICICVGTRPNFIKAAPIIRELNRQSVPYKLVHTGQHFDKNMSESLFETLGLPDPDINLNTWIPWATSNVRIAKIMFKFARYLKEINPDIVVVLGDVDSSLACALAANKAKIRVAHVEAGERSGDKSMPEEINRILIDEISDILFFASRQASERYAHGYFVGNVMIDQLRYDESKLSDFATRNESWAVLTLHRQSNVDNYDTFCKIYQIMRKIAESITIHFPVHPRTESMLLRAVDKLGSISNIIYHDPMPRLEFLALIANAKFVMTDSGGLQVETSYLNVPCLTLRNQTEWLDTVSRGSNVITGIYEYDILRAIDHILLRPDSWKQSTFKQDSLHDGHAAERIVEILKKGG